MKRRRLFLVLVLLLFLSGLALVPSIRWPIYGWVRGEAFYQGMPTSWWRGRIQRHVDAKETGRVQITWVERAVYRFGIHVSDENPFNEPEVLDDISAVPVLAEMVNDDDDVVCYAACDALGNLKPWSSNGVPSLLRMLQHADKARRRHASTTLVNIGSVVTLDQGSAASVPILIEALDDEDVVVAYNAAIALGQIGAKAKAAVPALVKLLHSERAILVVPGQHGQLLWGGVEKGLTQIDPEAAKAGIK